MQTINQLLNQLSTLTLSRCLALNMFNICAIFKKPEEIFVVGWSTDAPWKNCVNLARARERGSQLHINIINCIIFSFRTRERVDVGKTYTHDDRMLSGCQVSEQWKADRVQFCLSFANEWTQSCKKCVSSVVNITANRSRTESISCFFYRFHLLDPQRQLQSV